MQVVICNSKEELGRRAAADGAQIIRQAIETRGGANIVLATGASQLDMLAELTAKTEIDWTRVVAFHLDEYIGLPETHPGSFRRFLKERFVARLPQPLAQFHLVDGQTDPQAECERLGQLIAAHPIDVAFIGIGENGHLAFNDPPADFQTEQAYIVVHLDEACRRQQVGEGWYATIEDVPKQAISMSIRQIMKSRNIVCSVPELRKAKAVAAALTGPVTPDVPASVLQQHPKATIYLDPESASLLRQH